VSTLEVSLIGVDSIVQCRTIELSASFPNIRGKTIMANDGAELVEDGLMTVPEAQEFSRLSRSDLYARMERGALAYCKLGKRRMIPRRALVEMARQSLVVRQPAAAFA
jgi:Helix-turn-helix domain